jgi:hypothetical protein
MAGAPRSRPCSHFSFIYIYFYGSLSFGRVRAGLLIACHVTGVELPRPVQIEMVRYLTNRQNADGGWGLYVVTSAPTTLAILLHCPRGSRAVVWRRVCRFWCGWLDVCIIIDIIIAQTH